MEKNRVLNQSVTHLPSLFDAPGTEALTLRNIYRVLNVCTKRVKAEVKLINWCTIKWDFVRNREFVQTQNVG